MDEPEKVKIKYFSPQESSEKIQEKSDDAKNESEIIILDQTKSKVVNLESHREQKVGSPTATATKKVSEKSQKIIATDY